MSPVAAVAWGIEFALESTGALLAYRKRLKILFALLVWRAFMDVVTFTVFILHLHPGYGFTLWSGRAVQYALLYALGVQIAAKMVAEYRPISQHIYLILAAVASLATYIFVLTDVWAHKFLHAEAVTCFLLLAVVMLGGIGRKRDLEGTWQTITIGLLLVAFGNALCSLVSSYWSAGLSLFPIPAIISLCVWNLAARPEKKQKELPEFRMPLPAKKPPSSVHPASVKNVKLAMQGRNWVN